MISNTHLGIPDQDGSAWPHDHEGEPISADEMRAIMWELENAYGDELTDEIVKQAIEANLESKRTPDLTRMSHLDLAPRKVAS